MNTSFLNNMSKDHKRILFACFFAFFYNGFFTLMMGSVLPDLKLAYGLSDTQSGLMLSGHSSGNLIAGFLSGLVPLYIGRRKSIVCLCSLSFIGFAMTILFGNPGWLMIAFVLTGVGRGSVSNFNNGNVNRLTDGNPAASNLLHCFFAVGALSAPLIFLVANKLAGWRLAIGVIIAIGLAVVINFSTLRFEDDRPDRRDKTQSSMAFLKQPRFMVWALMMFFYLCSEYSINGWLVTYLQNKPALMTQFASGAENGLQTYSQTMATLLWVIILVGRLTCAALSQKIPQKRLMAVACCGVALFFVLLLFGGSVPVVTVAVAGLGFCMAGVCPMIYSDASTVTNHYPMGTSTLLALGSIGAILMPSIVGMTADRYGFTGGMYCILVSVLLLLALSFVNARLKNPIIESAREG